MRDGPLQACPNPEQRDAAVYADYSAVDEINPRPCQEHDGAGDLIGFGMRGASRTVVSTLAEKSGTCPETVYCENTRGETCALSEPPIWTLAMPVWS